MSHFAQLNENNVVTQVIVVNNNELLDEDNQESESKGITFCQTLLGGNWKQTSYNAKIRGKYAGIGDTYSEAEDLFIAPQPFASWTRTGSFWNPPVPYPSDGGLYKWNEDDRRWDEV